MSSPIDSINFGSKSFYCRALQGMSEYNICINSDLSVSCNCQDYDGSGKIGDLNTQSFEDIFFGETANRFRKNLCEGILPVSACKYCFELTPVDHTTQQSIPEVTLPKKGIMIENTAHCNLKCLSCPRDLIFKNRNKMKMSLVDLKKVSEMIRATNIEKVHYFNLGEPFLSNSIFEEIEILKESNPELIIYTSTNGIMLNKKTKLKAALMMDHIYFSIDGPSQKKVSKYQIGGDFATAYTNMKNLINARNNSGQITPSIEWKYVTFRWNDSKKDIKKAVRLAKKAGVDTISFWKGGGLPASFLSDIFSKNSFFNKLGVESWKGREINFWQIPDDQLLRILNKLGSAHCKKRINSIKKSQKDLAQVSLELIDNKFFHSDKDFIEFIYQIFLDRPADETGLNNALNAFRQQELSKGQFINSIINSYEFKHKLSH